MGPRSSTTTYPKQSSRRLSRVMGSIHHSWIFLPRRQAGLLPSQRSLQYAFARDYFLFGGHGPGLRLLYPHWSSPRRRKFCNCSDRSSKETMSISLTLLESSVVFRLGMLWFVQVSVLLFCSRLCHCLFCCFVFLRVPPTESVPPLLTPSRKGRVVNGHMTKASNN